MAMFNPNNVVINLAFYYASDQSMLAMAEGVGHQMDFTIFCTDACKHGDNPPPPAPCPNK